MAINVYDMPKVFCQRDQFFAHVIHHRSQSLRFEPVESHERALEGGSLRRDLRGREVPLEHAHRLLVRIEHPAAHAPDRLRAEGRPAEAGEQGEREGDAPVMTRFEGGLGVISTHLSARLGVALERARGARP